MILISGILVYKLAASFLGKEGFSEYALSRRTISLIVPVLFMGLGVGIPRYIAYASANPKPDNPDAYFLGGIYVLSLALLIFTIILHLLKKRFAFLFFGSSAYTYLMFPIVLVIWGLIVHGLCYSYFRGKLLMFKANLLQILNTGIIPLFAFFFGRTVAMVITLTGVSMFIVSIFFLFMSVRKIKLKKNIIPHTRELLVYGVQRVPGDFGLAALLTLPATFTVHMAGLEKAGYVAFGVSLLNMAGSFFAPIGIILLPKASRIVATKDFCLLKSYVHRLLKVTLLLTVIGIFFFETFAEGIIKVYLGKNFPNLVSVTRIIMISGLPYAIYVSMRSIIDAYYIKALNTKNIIISLFLFLMSSGIVVSFTNNYVYLIFSFVVAIFILGILTLIDVNKISERSEKDNKIQVQGRMS